MAKLIYGMGEASLDGYVADRAGRFDWVTPDDDLHRHAGAEQAKAGTVIYGRKMYEVLVFWETADQSRPSPRSSSTRGWSTKSPPTSYRLWLAAGCRCSRTSSITSASSGSRNRASRAASPSFATQCATERDRR